MMARKKIVPPVTPQIIQSNPRQKIFRYLLLVCTFLLAVWFSFDYGRTQTATGNDAPIEESDGSQQRIAALQQERETLKQQISVLKQESDRANQALAAAQARIEALQRAQSATPELPAETQISSAPVQPEQSGTALPPETDTLRLENVHIVATESDNKFRIGFSVLRDGVSSDRVTGTIWIAVNGSANGDPKSLPFKSLSPDRRLYVKMGFEQQQDVMEEVVLPENFHPKNMLIEVKPYVDKYTGTSGKFDWVTRW
jgi:cell division protein FtsB